MTDLRPLPRRRPRWGALGVSALLLLALAAPLIFGHVPHTRQAALSAGTIPASATHAPTSAPAPTVDTTTPRTASDHGVTPTTITLGVAVVDLGLVAQVFGANAKGLSVGSQETAFRAFAAELNARGGIGGRQVRLDFAAFNILDTSSQIAACKVLTEQRQDFAVLTTLGLLGSPVLCFTEDHHVPLLSNDGAPSDYYQSSGGRLFSLQPSTLRTQANAITALKGAGLLSRHVGIVAEDGYLRQDSQTLESYVRAATGQSVVTAQVSSNPAEILTALGQSRSAAVQLCAAGVDEVLIGVNSLYASQLVNSWQRTTCPSPTWITSDTQFQTAADSFLGDLPDAYFQHAYDVTSTIIGGVRSGQPLRPLDQRCIDVDAQQTGVRLPSDDPGRIIVVAACGLMALAEQGLLRAGANPTRASFANALGHLGAFDSPGFGPSSLRPAKLDAADSVRILRADVSCHCWKLTGDQAFHPAPLR